MATKVVNEVVDKSIDNTKQVKKIKPTEVTNHDNHKLFDESGKLLAIENTELPKVDELGLLKTDKKAETVKKSGKKVTPKEEKLYKYNTPTKELLKIRDTLIKENANNPIIKEIDDKIEKRRSQWKKFYQDNKEKYKQWSASWRNANKDKVAESQKRYAESTAPAKKTATKSKTTKKKSK